MIKVSGEFHLTCLNADGSVAWERRFKNAATNIGLGYLAGAAFSGTAQIATWYAGLISTAGFSAGLNVNDTMAAHAGWAEFTGYSGARPQWVNSGANGVVTSNGPFSFPITASGVIHGVFVVSNSTVGGTAGTLYAAALLPVDAVVSAGQTLTGTYSVTVVGG